MADSPKRLGVFITTVESISVTGDAVSGDILYTVPASTSAVVSTVFVCNRSESTANFTLAHVQNGGVDQLSPADYLYDLQIAGKDTFASTTGISMSAGDSLVVWADKLRVNFVAEGIEIT